MSYSAAVCKYKYIVGNFFDPFFLFFGRLAKYLKTDPYLKEKGRKEIHHVCSSQESAHGLIALANPVNQCVCNL